MYRRRDSQEQLSRRNRSRRVPRRRGPRQRLRLHLRASPRRLQHLRRREHLTRRNPRSVRRLRRVSGLDRADETNVRNSAAQTLVRQASFVNAGAVKDCGGLGSCLGARIERQSSASMGGLTPDAPPLLSTTATRLPSALAATVALVPAVYPAAALASPGTITAPVPPQKVPQ